MQQYAQNTLSQDSMFFQYYIMHDEFLSPEVLYYRVVFRMHYIWTVQKYFF